MRFRKSVTLMKGVKLNASKTGVSFTLAKRAYSSTPSSPARVCMIASVSTHW